MDLCISTFIVTYIYAHIYINIHSLMYVLYMATCEIFKAAFQSWLVENHSENYFVFRHIQTNDMLIYTFRNIFACGII